MPRRTFLLAVTLTLLAGAFLVEQSRAQRPDLQKRFAQMSADAEARGLKDAYQGITSGGRLEPGLFTIKSTGVTTEPVRQAAVAFLKTLTPEQAKKSQFPVDDNEWRKWMNQHFYVRQGVSFLEMTPAQRDAAFRLIGASLSARGLKLTRDIMHLNETLGELNNNDFEQYGEWRYHLTFMGQPSAKDPWGWQLDGHHVIINYFVMGDQVVMTPLFVGSEPVIAESGKYKGTAILQQEQAGGLALLRALSDSQRKQAILEVSKTGNNNLGEAFKDNFNLDYAGAPVKEMTAAQREQFVKLVDLFIGNLDDGHARVKMSEIRQHLDRTYFAWIGGTGDQDVYYYRIHSPVVLIEFDHQRPAGLRHLFPPDQPMRQHIHVVVRTPNGNDYGKDLLRQHYASAKH
jgi:hypothetical protein